MSTMRFSTVCLSAICLIQIGFLYFQVATNVSPYYPVAYDQLRYLNEAYKLSESFVQEGVLAVARQILSPYSPNGFLLSLEGGLLAALSGGHRAAALSVNIILLILTQCFLLLSVKRQFSEAAAWCAVTLFLLTATPFLNAGGIFDFRIDFSAFCIFGIWTGMVLSSRIFLERKSSLLAGFVAGWLVLTRFITFVYLGTIVGLLVCFFALVWIIRRDPLSKKRCLNAALSGAIMSAMFAPFFVINAKIIYNYYFVGLFVGSEPGVRALEFGIDTPIKHLLFYPAALLFYHLGFPFLIFAGACLVFAGVQHRIFQTDDRYDWRRNGAALGFLICVIAVPFAFVNLSASKSPVIIGVVGIPVILLVTVLIDTILGERIIDGRFSSWQAKTLGALCIAIAFSVFLFRAAAPKCRLDVSSCFAVNDFSDEIIKYARANLGDAPIFSSDNVTEMFNYLALSDRSFEQPGSPVNFLPGYDLQILSTTKEDILSRFSQSDVVVLSDPLLGRNSVYPSNVTMTQYWPELRTFVTKNMISVARANIAGVPFEAFVKPAPKIPK